MRENEALKHIFALSVKSNERKFVLAKWCMRDIGVTCGLTKTDSNCFSGNEEYKGFIETIFKTNDLPHGGECVINPTIGYAVLTPFRVNCSEWKDEDRTITYRITMDSEIEGFMYSGRDLNQPIYLPYHHSFNTSSLNLNVYVIDKYGNYNVTTVSVEVTMAILLSLNTLLVLLTT